MKNHQRVTPPLTRKGDDVTRNPMSIRRYKIVRKRIIITILCISMLWTVPQHYSKEDPGSRIRYSSLLF